MPLTSDSSNGGRRNVFDVSAPVLAAAEGAPASGRSIFAVPRATAAASGRASTHRGGRPGRVDPPVVKGVTGRFLDVGIEEAVTIAN